MAWKPKVRNHASIVKYHPEDPYAQSKTEAQWNKEKRVVIGLGEEMYTNSNYSKATYYLPEATRPATPEELAAIREKKMEKRAAKKAAQEAAAERERARKAEQMARLRRYIDLDPASIICLDTETTGVGYDDEILQLSIMDGRGEVLFNDHFRPKAVTEWPEAQMVHGISPEAVAQCPHIDSCIPRINEILSNAELIIGYNLDFDLSFIRLAGITVPEGINQFDVMPEFAEIYGEWHQYRRTYKWQKLSACADYFGYEGSSFHDSLEDVRATLFCYFALTKYDPTEGRTTI